jgi:DNA ligase (NAD+)
MTQIDSLAQRIQTARDAYYNGIPLMEDSVYDALEDELRRLDPAHALFTVVGAAVQSGGWVKARHTIAMTSLNKAQTHDDFKGWHEDCGSVSGVDALIATDKCDGISIELTYKGRKLVQAVTRGDGEVGEDITRNVKLMQGIHHELPDSYEDFAEEGTVAMPDEVYIRGEIVVLLSDFATYFKGESNARNTASGTAKRQSDASKCKHLTILCYQFLPNGVPLATKEAELQALREMQFATPNWSTFASLDAAKSYYEEYNTTTRAQLDYLIDGIVFELNDSALREMLGELNGRPKAAVAFKFPSESATTTLQNIAWQVGKSGRITPVAEFDTVSLAGANVSRASLHNVGNLTDLADQIGQQYLKAGDTILVSRRNDVIPFVESAVTAASHSVHAAFIPPTTCPCCNGNLSIDGAYLVCTNDECDAQVTGAIKRWVQKVGILHFGDAMIEAMVDSGMVSDIADLYTVTPLQVSTLEMDGRRIGGAADRAFDSLYSKMEMPIATLVGSLGIPLIGRSMVRTIAEAGYDTLDRMEAATLPQVASISGVGPTKAAAFTNGFKVKRGLIIKLLANGVKIKVNTGALVGQTFCCTGFRDATLAAAIESQGGTMKDSAGKSLTYLVALDPNGGSSKLAAARKNGTQVIGKAEAYKLAGL